MGNEPYMVAALIPNDEFSEETLHRARLAVAANSTDRDDCRMLLDMLGLL